MAIFWFWPDEDAHETRRVRSHEKRIVIASVMLTLIALAILWFVGR